MPLGEYIEPKEFIIELPDGSHKDFKAGGEYYTLFMSEVYNDTKQIEISDAKDYFSKLGKIYCDEINEQIQNHCVEYIYPLLDEANQKRCMAGFGGDCMDGLIDCYSSEPLNIEGIPDLTFQIQGEDYRMKWRYCTEEDFEE
jgi:hypothetical protein